MARGCTMGAINAKHMKGDVTEKLADIANQSHETTEVVGLFADFQVRRSRLARRGDAQPSYGRLRPFDRGGRRRSSGPRRNGSAASLGAIDSEKGRRRECPRPWRRRRQFLKNGGERSSRWITKTKKHPVFPWTWNHCACTPPGDPASWSSSTKRDHPARPFARLQPGRRRSCLEIARDSATAYDYTAKGNVVAIISNGTAVLGLGNLGALAFKPCGAGRPIQAFRRYRRD